MTLPLGKQLDDWLREHPLTTKENEPKRLTRRPAERVLTSLVKWKPIDYAAAMLLARAHWLSKPNLFPQPKPIEEKRQRKPKPRKDRQMKEDIEIPNQQTGGVVDHSGRDGGKMYNIADLAVGIIEHINKQPHSLTELAKAALDARNSLRENLKELGSGMEDFDAKAKVYLVDLRQTRYALVTEVAHMTNSLKEIRAFFIGSTYEQEIARLKEFVDLCERLQKLKDSGFLDSVADTMIRLACNTK